MIKNEGFAKLSNKHFSLNNIKRDSTKNCQINKRTKNCKACKKLFCDISVKGEMNCCGNHCKHLYSAMVRKKNGSYIRTKEQNEKMVATMIEKYADSTGKMRGRITKNGREMLSKNLKNRWQNGTMLSQSQQTSLKNYGSLHWTQASSSKTLLSKRMSSWQKNLNEEQRKEINRKIISTKIKNKTFANGHSRGKGGYRKDIGIYVRSKWEANFARILSYLNVLYSYEPKSYILSDGTQYTPDFITKNGRVIEIKGWMDKRSKKKIDLFKSEYPNEIFILIDNEKYKKLKNKFEGKIIWEN